MPSCSAPPASRRWRCPPGGTRSGPPGSMHRTCGRPAGRWPAATRRTLLDELLGELHGLLGAGTAYLDAAEGEQHAGVEIH